MSDEKELEIQVDRTGRLAVVSVSGQIVRDNQKTLRKRLEQLIADGVTRLAIDLQKVPYMDSAGLGCCSSVQKLISRGGSGIMVVFALPEHVEKTWVLIRLDLVIPIFPDRERAIQWLHHVSRVPHEP